MHELRAIRDSAASPFSIRIYLKDEKDPREVDIISLLGSYVITSPDYILLISTLRYAGAAQVLYPHMLDRTACIVIGGDDLQEHCEKTLLVLIRYLMFVLGAEEAELTFAGKCTVYTMS